MLNKEVSQEDIKLIERGGWRTDRKVHGLGGKTVQWSKLTWFISGTRSEIIREIVRKLKSESGGTESWRAL